MKAVSPRACPWNKALLELTRRHPEFRGYRLMLTCSSPLHGERARRLYAQSVARLVVPPADSPLPSSTFYPYRLMSTAVAKTNSAVAAPANAASALQSFNVLDPQSMLDSANALQKFIVDNKLSSNISGKNYANVEAWQFLFALAGYDVIVDEPVLLKRGEGIIAYKCCATIYDRDGKMVGRGFAECDSNEKKGYKEFAIMSFSQTRAIGKAGRNKFAFILKAAGYEPTPAEEMGGGSTDFGTGAVVLDDDTPPLPSGDVDEVPAPPHPQAAAPTIQPVAETQVENKVAPQAPKKGAAKAAAAAKPAAPATAAPAAAPAPLPAPSGDDDEEVPPLPTDAPAKPQFSDVIKAKMLQAIDEHGLTAVAGIRERINNYSITPEQKAALTAEVLQKGFNLETGKAA